MNENIQGVNNGPPILFIRIIAVNYPARDKGVQRHMRGDDAKAHCPEIVLVQVPEVRGKAELSKYRDAGKRVVEVLQTFSANLQRASVDEAYMDITAMVEQRIQAGLDIVSVDKLQNTYVVGSTIVDFVQNVCDHRLYDEANFKLALGGVIAEEVRAEIFKVTGYKCSAGIAHNKILAKLVCGLHKPNKQTILPHEAVPELYKNMPIKKITSLGGKFGDEIMEKLNIKLMSELSTFSHKDLTKKFDEKSASWLYNIAKGIDYEPVNTRLISKSIGCCKKFPGKGMLCIKEDLEHWLNDLCEELAERLSKDFEENNRKAKQMVVSFAQEIENNEIHSTKSHPLNSYEQCRIFENAMKVIQKNCMQDDGTYRITYLGVSAGNFQDFKKNREITSFFEQMRMNSNNSIQKFDNSKQKHFFSEVDTLTREDRKGDADDDKTSIYSADTEEDEDNVNSDDLIYFEQINPESLLDENFEFNSVISTKSGNSLDFCREHSDTHISNSSSPIIRLDPDLDISQDSISNEFNKPVCDSTNNGDHSPVTNSFFTRYFSQSLKRNFDTSKIFEEDTDYDSPESDQPADQCSKVVKSTIEETIENQRCPECGKYVDQDNFQSHNDYHVALRIVKSETHLYKNDPPMASTSTENQVVPKYGPKNTKKRKIEDVASSQKPISKYFSTNENAEGPWEICEECNKPVLVSEWNVHKDFHTAKRIHLELNSVPDQPIIQKVVAAKPKSFGQLNILGFFKSAES
ncbi:DNA polymerase eta isoform X2 [Euwallacea fornicatus]|uniref:DNA polymerase eta isoform X2 n=1 Tax=Euwallacea fornicatus TaxID=995702 RepID=UPI00338FA346